MKVLICRTDALGDCITIFPAIQQLKAHYLDVSLDVLIAQSNSVLFKNNPLIGKIHTFETTSPQTLATEGYDCAVAMLYTTSIGKLLKKARIPARIGPLSKLSSLYYLNAGIRQHRSACLKNEAEYNCDLLASRWPRVHPERPRLFYKGELGEHALPQEFIVVAPQGRGSTLNLSEETWEKIILHCAGKKAVVITGLSPSVLAERLVQTQSNVINLCNKTSLENLIAVINRADFVIAPSSGTLHLANALGKRIISFYPPARVMSPKRWAPLGYEGKIFVKDVDCGKHCRRSCTCTLHCMSFDFNAITAAISSMLPSVFR